MKENQNRTQAQGQTAQHLFVKIGECSRITGLSQCYLRKRCRERSIPVTMAGTVYYIHLPALLEQLEQEARNGGRQV